MSAAIPMDVDPIDGGPREKGVVPMTAGSGSSALVPASGPMHEISKEEEARQAVDMLRGDDVAQRIAAASRLEAVAAVLGEERTREVSDERAFLVSDWSVI